MKPAAFSILIRGIYLLLLGASLAILPTFVLPILGFPLPADVWIRLVGVLVIIIGYYCVMAAHANDVPFIRSTLLASAFLFISTVLFAALRLVSPVIIAFGVVELAGAAWTWRAYRTSGKAGEL